MYLEHFIRIALLINERGDKQYDIRVSRQISESVG